MDQVLVRFLARFEYTPSDRPYVTIAYPEGYEGEVDWACCNQALAKGAAIEIDDEFAAQFADVIDPEDEAD